MTLDVEAYLEWLGFGGTPRVDLATLTELQQLHLSAVPFENLSIALGTGVSIDADLAVDKIVEQGRGGWCFELNAAFAALLRELGFDVILLGAAVLLGGPSRRIDHLALEVNVGEPMLVDVGFGDSFTRPLPLNDPGPHEDATGRYEFIGSPQGTTLAKLDESGRHESVPVAQYRFKRVAHRLEQFTPASEALQADDTSTWRRGPFATRLLDRGPDRVTLTIDKLKVVRDGKIDTRAIAIDEWASTLHQWFGIRLDESELVELARFAPAGETFGETAASE